MINVENKPYYCKEKDCKLHPNFNYEGEKSGLYCSKHKKDMIDVVSRKCKEKDCNFFPSFNYVGEKEDYIAQNIRKIK